MTKQITDIIGKEKREINLFNIKRALKHVDELQTCMWNTGIEYKLFEAILRQVKVMLLNRQEYLTRETQ